MTLRNLFSRLKRLFWKIVIQARWRLDRTRGREGAIGARAPGGNRATPERIVRTRRFDFPLLLDPDDWVGAVLGLQHPQGACPLYNLLFNLFFLDRFGTVRLRSHLSAISEAQFLDAFRSIGVLSPGEKRESGAA